MPEGLGPRGGARRRRGAYVTEDLDEGPIIEQDVVRVTHADSVRDQMRRGADVERTVLARAVGWHCGDRVLRDGNSTVVLAS
ncbi:MULTISPECIES: formyltransferase family protein [Streptomyces]|uniref:formyltransferase family protein n=1 Tax=Streptomyces TaxID=1883 RepID=UPI001F0BA372|nr:MULTISPECIES: formyltransferase family protein [Streptomyces]